MGVVLQAEDTQLQRIVALKVILPEFAADPTARERFLREARAGAALKNDHLVTIYQVGEDRQIPYLAMEFLHGQTLEERLKPGEPFPLAEAVRIGREVATGLAVAHAHGLIHRDVKPSNIWLEAPGGRAKLLDFGLARSSGSRSGLTTTGGVVGTPEYMSPEQARGDELDARSDLFSLGAVLYAMCSGQRPFQGNSVMAVLTALAVETPRPLRALNHEVPPALAGLVNRLMQKKPAKRPASAAEVVEALEAIEASLPAASRVARRSGSQSAPAPITTRSWVGKSLARRRVILAALGAVILIGASAFAAAWFRSTHKRGAPSLASAGPPIRLGVLFSRTGTMAISERPVIDAVLLAVDEINEQGGLLGRKVEAVLADGQSDETEFARQAEKLITEDRVCTIIGCWTSASRKAVVPVVERYDHLLLYPVQYEGAEQSRNVVYLGPVPNQQILPALRWLVGFEGRTRWFLVGSDYVFPATANAVIRDEAKARGNEIVGERYAILGATDVGQIVEEIKKTSPDLIVNTINGDTNVAFFRALRRAGITAKTIPTVSFSISEEELGSLGPRQTAGDYVAGNYFHTLDISANRAFRERFAKRYGSERLISSAMESAYAGVQLWAKAVRAADHADARKILKAIKGKQYDAPQGPMRIDPATLHTVQIARVGCIDESGRLMEVFATPQPVVPEPFPSTRTQEEWLSFVESLHERWGGRWSNPGP
jgi:urea transport system substrate-binding protein